MFSLAFSTIDRERRDDFVTDAQRCVQIRSSTGGSSSVGTIIGAQFDDLPKKVKFDLLIRELVV